MANIIINNGNGGVVNIYTENTVSKAKDTLLNRMYHARNSDNVIGGREGWLKLLDMYYSNNFKGMKDYIKSCKGRCGTRRKEMLDCIDIIIND